MLSNLRFFDGNVGKANANSDDINAIASAMAGDIVAVISPETVSTAAASVDDRVVTVTLTNTAGLVHTWCNKAIATTVSAAESSQSGTISVASATITFVNGVATIPVTIGGTYAKNETNTVTIANMAILGVTVTGGTSVQTAT